MIKDETQIQIALGFLDSCTEEKTGFLPGQTPTTLLEERFAGVAQASAGLVEHYHGPDSNCRPWLKESFDEFDSAWSDALKGADESLLVPLHEALSLLCHAYRCGNARASEPLDNEALPVGLGQLWEQVSRALDVPTVGSYYSMLLSNWRLPGVDEGSDYDLDDLVKGEAQPLHTWLDSKASSEWSELLNLSLLIESKGKRFLDLVGELLGCVLRGNAQEATYRMMIFSAAILSLNSTFNRTYKRRKTSAVDSSEVIYSTLLPAGGPGASSLQSPTFQLLESVFGLDRESEWGQTVLEARRYMLSDHRKLLQVLDQTNPLLRRFVESARSPRLLDAYNRTLAHLKTWRLLYQRRGLLVSESEKATKITNQALPLEGDWKGTEWSLEFLFRFLTDDQRAILDKNMETIHYKAGEPIIQQGDLFPGLFVLKSGSASVKKATVHGEKVVDTVGPEELFGEMSLVENLPASASIVADVDLQAQQVSLETVYSLVDEHRDVEGGFYLALAQLISHRLRRVFSVG